MNHTTATHARSVHRRRRNATLRIAPFALLLLALPASADSDKQAITARGSLNVASMAADAWVDDARLVWVENDAPVDAAGRAVAWGYLFYSPSQGAMRSYSVRHGVIVEAEDHTVTARAPGLEPTWLDSAPVTETAWKHVGDFRATGCVLESLLLVRGVFSAGAAWVVVFSNGPGPRLHVVLDAANAKVVRRWRG